MPEDLGDKTEEATPRRREEARERGQVAHSADLSAALILLGGLLVIRLTGSDILRIFLVFMRAGFEGMDVKDLSRDDICGYFGLGVLTLLRALLPFIGGLVAVAYASNVIQTGFLFSGQPLAFRGDRINPIEGVRRLISKRGLVRLTANLFKIVVIGLVSFFTIYGQFPKYMALVDADFRQVAMFLLSASFELAFKIAIALVALAILDFLFQRWQYEQDLRMTKQEVRDELRRMEGDPLTRDRRRRLQRQVAMQRMMHAVPKADVVVTNPTHIAVALRYDAKAMDAPTVVAKGKGYLAERIRQVAQANHVPVVERRPLARALYKMCEVGQRIPRDLYQAVAEVLAFVYELGRMKLPKSGRAEARRTASAQPVGA